MKKLPKRLERIADRARAMYADPSDNDLEIDDILTEADFSEGDDGTWVRAWVWVPKGNKK